MVECTAAVQSHVRLFASFKLLNITIIRLHGVQRCSLLLPVFHGLCICACPLDVTLSCAKTSRLIKMPFRAWTGLDSRNHVLGGGLVLRWEGAILGGPFAVRFFFKVFVLLFLKGIHYDVYGCRL